MSGQLRGMAGASGALVRVAVLAVLAGILAVGCAEAPPAPPPPPGAPPRPPGFVQVHIPDPFFGSDSAFATAWCDGTTRVHVVTSNTDGYDGEGPHVAQTLEPNAALCGGRQ